MKCLSKARWRNLQWTGNGPFHKADIETNTETRPIPTGCVGERCSEDVQQVLQTLILLQAAFDKVTKFRLREYTVVQAGGGDHSLLSPSEFLNPDQGSD